LSSSLEGRIDIRLTRHGDAVTDVEIRSSRPQLAQKLMAGRGPEEAADLAGLIFSLCGKAQKVAAQAACEAARGLIPGRDAPAAGTRRAGGTGPGTRLAPAAELAGTGRARRRTCPACCSCARRPKTRLLSPTSWKTCWAPSCWASRPEQWLARDLAGFDIWRRDGRSLVAKLFADLGDGPDPGVSRCPLLPPLAKLDAGPAADLARRALADPAYCAAPLWHGAPAETGALARMADHPMLAAWIARRGRGAGARLLARLLELAELPQRLRAEPDPAGRRSARWSAPGPWRKMPAWPAWKPPAACCSMWRG
jgi:hypothetical protein